MEQQLSTIGKAFEYCLNIKYEEDTYFDNECAIGNRFSFVFIEEGCGVMNRDGISFAYMAPTMLCISEKEHLVIPYSETQRIRVVYIHPDAIHFGLNFDLMNQPPLDLPATMYQDINLFRFFTMRTNEWRGILELGPMTAKKVGQCLDMIKLFTYEQEDPFWPCRTRSYILEILFLQDRLEMKNTTMPTYVDGENVNEIEPILKYLFINYSEKITIADLTKQFQLNRTTLAQLFQDALGESVITYLNKLRIQIASGMLRDTMLPVNDIMERVGFHDGGHFFRTYKKYTGLSPSEYREQYNWMI